MNLKALAICLCLGFSTFYFFSPCWTRTRIMSDHVIRDSIVRASPNPMGQGIEVDFTRSTMAAIGSALVLFLLYTMAVQLWTWLLKTGKARQVACAGGILLLFVAVFTALGIQNDIQAEQKAAKARQTALPPGFELESPK